MQPSQSTVQELPLTYMVTAGTPIPKLSDNEDEDMIDAPPTDAPTPIDNDDEDQSVAADEDDEDQDQEANDDDAEPEAEPEPTPLRASRTSTPRRRGRPPGPNARTRRVGRPRKHDTPDDGEGGSDTGTPRRARGGFRGHRGGRWGKVRGGPSRVTAAPIDDEGNQLEIIDDEVELPEDPEGEPKVDKLGHLQGGREYRVRTFTIAGRGERLYMLSTEPARCIGFRDSYLFFQKHKYLYKIIIDDDEKRDLIERDLIPHSYKGRAIGVVTARSVFREFGAKIIIGGKKVIDDYDVNGARERGDPEGELAVPEDRLPAPGESYNRNQYVAWHGASAVYHTNAPSLPVQGGKVIEAKRRRVTVTSDNWMLEHAREARYVIDRSRVCSLLTRFSRFNSILTMARKDNEHGIYDIHTNLMQEPADMQPTHARWEEVQTEAHLVNGTASSHKFGPLNSVYTRNFRIHDLCLQSMPESKFPKPHFGLEPQGLSSISSQIWSELPSECRAAFESELAKERDWNSQWLGEHEEGLRAKLLPSVEWFKQA